MWPFGNLSAAIIATTIVCGRLPCWPNAASLITSLRLCFTASINNMILSAQWESPLGNRSALRFCIRTTAKAGKKALNVQSKWDSTASIIADVCTVKKNGFLKNSFIGLIGLISSIG